MAQVFSRSSNAVARVTLVSLVCAPFVIFGVVFVFVRSPYVTQAEVPIDQPIPFSHKHHVGDDGIACQYCHTSVETSSFAGMPSSETCMNCHSQVWNQSDTLAAVRQSVQTGQPLVWERVHKLPDFVYFNHSIHVQKGVACETCHGRVDEMPRIMKVASLQMQWCLDCHRDPASNIRPREDVTAMGWQPPAHVDELQRQLALEYHIQSKTDCSTCHR
ncbi:MAG: cytochrome c3 family protein [Chloroflexota bacterium]